MDLLIYPLDTIKTRYQSQDFLKTFASSTKRAKVPASVFRGLYQGVGSVIVATLPAGTWERLVRSDLGRAIRSLRLIITCPLAYTL